MRTDSLTLADGTSEPPPVQHQMLPVRTTALLVTAICYIGLVANQTQARGLAEGKRLDLSQATVGSWQYVREALALLLFAALANRLIAHRQAGGESTGVPLAALFIGTFVVLEVVSTLVRASLPPTAVLTGLRFAYFALIAFSIRHYSAAERSQLLRLAAVMLAPLLLTESFLAVQQVIVGRPTLGTTQFGSRPWGTYSSSNNLGLAMLGIALVVALARNRLWPLWMSLCGVVCLLSGSRTAILGFTLIIGGMMVARWRNRLVGFPFAGLGMYCVYAWASSAAVSGRAISGEGRFSTWAVAWDSLNGLGYIFGQGVGAGTNSLVALVGYAQLANTSAVSDSTFIAALISLGATGLVIYVAAYALLWKHIPFGRRLVILPAMGMAMATFNIPEVSPFNILLALVVGCSLPTCQFDQDTISRNGTVLAVAAPRGDGIADRAEM